MGKFQVEPSLAIRKQGAAVRAYFVADGRPFSQVMDAIVSNGNPVDTPEGQVELQDVSLVLERPG